MRKSDYLRRRLLWDRLVRFPVPLLNRWARAKVYDKAFFEDATPFKEGSAAAVAQVLTAHYAFRTVFDMGCGIGLYLREFAALGKCVLGCDGSLDAVRNSVSGVPVFRADVTKALPQFGCPFDVVVCFEVAEHVPPRSSKHLVRNCVTLGRRVLFTAAPPGQGGVGHINERPREFWVELFADEGCQDEAPVAAKVREAMRAAGVVPWIADNLMSFSTPSAIPTDVVT